MAVTAKEKREIEKYVKSLYDNVISVKIEEDEDNPAELTCCLRLNIHARTIQTRVSLKERSENKWLYLISTIPATT